MKISLISGRLGLFLLGILLVLVGGVAAVAYLPRAIVTISPLQETVTVSQRIILSNSTKEPDFVRLVLPLKIASEEAEVTQVYERQRGEQYEDFAKGTVHLINKQPTEQHLLPQTHLRHEGSGVFFLTDEATVVPPQGEVAVKVTAKDKGVRGNVEPGRLVVDKLSPYLQQVLWAESDFPFTGGVAVKEPVTAEELARAEAEMRAAAREKARAQLNAKSGGALVREELISFGEEEWQVSTAAGSNTNKYTARAKTVAKALLADENDILSLTLLKLRELTDEEQELIRYEPESFELELVQADFTRGEAVVEGKVTGVLANKISSTAFAPERLAGLTANEAREWLRQVPGVGEAEITLSPFWVSAVPARPGATQVVVREN